jgi:hypothetical protein
MSSVEKAATISAISLAVQRLSLAGIQARHPEASESECLLRLAVVKLGRELASKAYPDSLRLTEPGT